MRGAIDAGEMFMKSCKTDLDRSGAIAAIEVLNRLIKRSDVSTVQGLHDVLNGAISDMCKTEYGNASVRSACELFQRFITLTVSEAPDDFYKCKQMLEERAAIFLSKVTLCRQRIAKNFSALLKDKMCLLIHSHSRVVISALEHVVRHVGVHGLVCYVTTGLPHESGRKVTRILAKLGVNCSLIPDLAVAYVMPQIDAVLLGAEAVVESGGILNQMGSSTVSMIASAFRKPVYVLAESFKFIRAFPLDQRHIPEEFKWRTDLGALAEHFKSLHLNSNQNRSESTNDANESINKDTFDFPEQHSAWGRLSSVRVPDIELSIPSVDYTNPCYITYLVTDLGVLTPSVVSDELIKLYL